MAATASVRVVKSFAYRGTTRLFSNRYHIGTSYPADSAHWTTLCDAITAAERLLWPSSANGGATITQAVGYAPGSEVPVFTKTYSLAGTAAWGGYKTTAGDVAALIRYTTPDRSTKNHPVYCFNYYHAAMGDSAIASGDAVCPGQLTALGVYAAAWVAGFSDGVTTFKRSRPTGDLVTGYVVKPYLTHRDLPR